MASSSTPIGAKKSSSEIQQEISRTMCSLSRTVGQLESELQRFRHRAPTDFFSVLGSSLGRTALEGAIRRRPLLSVFTAATVGVAVSQMKRLPPYPGSPSLSRGEHPGRWRDLSALAFSMACEAGISTLLRGARPRSE
jgi:hypothetical protein